jgi:hypothetical protein
MSKVLRTGNYPPHYGYSEPTDDPEPQTGRAGKLSDFDDQLAFMSEEQWALLTELLHETKDPELVEFFETHLTHEG